MRQDYVHGYGDTEARRLHNQARTLEALLHHDTAYPAGSTVLEAGCGVGAQTLPLLRNSPGARITCVDLSLVSLSEAEACIRVAGLPVPTFRHADLYALPFSDSTFDHVFVCFVLEHLQDPDIALAELCRVLQPGGTLTVIEGDHGSTLFHPDDLAARSVIRCQVELQRLAGGDPEIGRRLRPLLVSAGLCDVHIEPRLIYADEGSPTLMSGFVRDTFTSMMAGVGKEAIRAGLMEAEAFEAGIQALLRTTEQGGVFCYTFFKARAFKAAARLLA